jgi:hypothetical protein
MYVTLSKDTCHGHFEFCSVIMFVKFENRYVRRAILGGSLLALLIKKSLLVCDNSLWPIQVLTAHFIVACPFRLLLAQFVATEQNAASSVVAAAHQ